MGGEGLPLCGRRLRIYLEQILNSGTLVQNSLNYSGLLCHVRGARSFDLIDDLFSKYARMGQMEAELRQ